MGRFALLVVDVQLDFLPGGALGVADGDLVLGPTLRLLDQATFDLVLASQDHHPLNHVSFASRWKRDPFTKFRTPDFGQGERECDLWPDHCVQQTRGAEIEDNVKARLDKLGAIVVQKGMNHNEDAYSAFATRADPPFAHESLAAKALRDANITDIFILGLATDYCVRATVLAALEASSAMQPWRVYVVEEACRGVDAERSKETLDELRKAGATVISIDGEELKPLWKEKVE